MLGGIWGQEEKGTTEDEMAGWHHRLSGRGFGWTPGVDDGQGGLVCCSSWGCKETQPVHSKRDQSWVLTGRTDAKAETLVLWPPHEKS